MGDLADELLLLPTDRWRQIGYTGDGTRSTVCGALHVEDWVAGGPAPAQDDVRHRLRKETSGALERVVEPLVAAGRVEVDAPRRKLFGLIRMSVPYCRVHDVTGRDAVVSRVEQSLGGHEPPPLHDAALAAILVAGNQWEKTGFDGPEPRPRVYAGSDPPPWGPLMACARQLASGEVVAAGVTDRDVLPMIAREVREQLMLHGGM